MPYGLKDSELEKMCGVFASNERIGRVVLYGSRAKGNYKPFSDVDITLMGEKLTHSDLNRISLAVDDLLLPYQFDISIFHTLKNEALIDHIHRIGITIYERESEWKEYKLGEIASEIGDGLHGTPKYSENGDYYFINGNNISDGRVTIKSDTKKVSEEEFEKYKKHLSDRTILMSINGTIGNVGFYNNEKCVLGKSACYLNIKNEVDKQFIYYTFLTEEFQSHLLNIATGTTIQNVPLKGLRDSIILLPPLDTQRRIASILTSLDDKIDLLRRENATLEAMAETLFRQWFVEEAKEDWEEGKLGDYVDLVNGVSYKGNELQPSNVAMVTLKSFDRNGGFRMDGYKEFTGKFKKEQVLYDGDLVVAHTDITQEADVIGNPVIVIGKNQYETITFSMDVVKVVSKSEFFSNSFLYYLMKTQAFKEHCLGYANGSTVLHLSKKAIPEFEFHIPPKIIAQSFQKQVESINKKILNNNNEIQTLIQMRDGLLPRLMSGEVKM